MNYSNYQFSLDAHEINSQITLTCKRGETGRCLFITFTEEGKLFDIGPDCHAVFTATKPDGKVIFNDCEIDNNIICYKMTPQTVAVEGKLDCEIRLYGPDNILIISPYFNIYVYPSVVKDGDVVESVNEVSTLTALIAEADTLISEVNVKLVTGEFIPKLSVGKVKTLPSDTMATVEITGDPRAPVLNFAIPQGSEGRPETLIPDSELSPNSLKPVQNKVIFDALTTKADAKETADALATKADAKETADALGKALKKLFVVGPEEPESGPALWLNTNYSVGETAVATLALDDDETGAAMVAHVDGEDYAVNNTTLNSTPTETDYDFTII